MSVLCIHSKSKTYTFLRSKQKAKSGAACKRGKLSIFDPRKNHLLINFLTLLLTTSNFNTTPEKLSCYTKMTKSGAKDIILKSLSKLKLKYSMSRKLVKPWISALRATRLSEAGGECFAPCIQLCFCAAARRNCQKRCPGTPEIPRNPENCQFLAPGKITF